MKRFIADVYKVLYRLTGNKQLSVIIAVLYMSALNLLTIYGLVFLLRGLVARITILLTLFSFPYYFFTIAAMLVFNLWLLMPFKDLSKGKRIKPVVTPIIVYSFVAMVLFLYGRYFDSIKF